MDTQSAQPFAPTPVPAAKPSPSVIPPPTPVSKGWLWVLVVALVLVFVYGAAAYFSGMWPFGAGGEPSPSPSASVSSDETSGWETYQNVEYGFEVKYPSDWTYDGTSTIYFGQIDPKTGKRMFSEGTGGFSLSVVAESVDTLYTSVRNNCQGYGDAFHIADPIFAYRAITLSGKNGWQVDCNSEYGGPYVVTVVSATMSKTIRIDSGYQSALHNQILSTFRFTTADPTAGWETYTNTQYGFEIQYPPASLSGSPCAGIAWTVTEQANPFSSTGGLKYYSWIGVSTTRPPDPAKPGCGDEMGGGEALPLRIYEGRTLASLTAEAGSSGAPGISKKTSSMIVAGVNATVIDVSQAGTDHQQHLVYVPRGNKVFVFGSGAALPNVAGSLFDQILSTFRFTK